DAIGALQRRLIKRNFDARPLKFDPADPKVPDDATVVVLPGPRQPFAEPIAAALRKYMDERKGKLVALIGVPPSPPQGAMPNTGLEPLFASFQVQLTKARVLTLPTLVGDVVIRDPEVTLAMVPRDQPTQNPIATAFRDTPFAFFQSRVVRPSPSGPP